MWTTRGCNMRNMKAHLHYERRVQNSPLYTNAIPICQNAFIVPNIGFVRLSVLPITLELRPNISVIVASCTLDTVKPGASELLYVQYIDDLVGLTI